MGSNVQPEHDGPSEEVGSEGGSPGDVDVHRERTTKGSEATSTVATRQERQHERDRQLTRDDRERP